MCRTHSATKTKILFLKWWWTLIEKGHKVSESMTFSNFSRTFRNAEKSSKNNLNAWWETTGANKTYKAQPQPKANQKENEPKRWLIFWIGERWVKVIGERGEPKRWWIITAGERNEPKRWCQYLRTAKGTPNLWQCHILPHIGSVARHLFRLCTRDGMYEPSFQWSISWPHKPC